MFMQKRLTQISCKLKKWTLWAAEHKLQVILSIKFLRQKKNLVWFSYHVLIVVYECSNWLLFIVILKTWNRNKFFT